MKKHLLILMALLMAGSAFAQKKEIIKKGWNFGPLPAISWDDDLGLQYGITCDIFNYGDGSLYPRYKYKFNVEASRYTKGSGVFRFYSDMPYVVKDTKLFVDVTYFYAKKYEFFGFNGYESSVFDPNQGFIPDTITSSYHFINRNQFRFVGSMQRPFLDVPNLFWTAGLAYYNTSVSPIDTVKLTTLAGQKPTLYENYVKAGVIHADEATGGNVMQLRLGMIYDSRDHNSDPTKGIYAEATLIGAPDLIDRKGYSNLSFTFIWRQYLPLYRDKLTLAYRLGAQNRIAGKTPWYMINNLNTLFFQKMYTEGLGGAVTMRGVNRNGVIGEGFAFGNLELRWRIIGFQFINQNWQVALNPFFDAGIVTQTQKFREDDLIKAQKDYEATLPASEKAEKLYYSGETEGVHTSAGCGLKLIMNRNMIIAVDMGRALDKRDGEKLKTFIGFNYIF